MAQRLCNTCPVSHTAVCAALDDAELRDIERIASWIDVPKHTDVFDQGQPADALYNLVEGVVKLYRLLPDGNLQVVGFRYPGDFLGVGDGDVHVCGAEALTEVRLCRYPRVPFDKACERHPDLRRKLFEVVARNLAAARNHMMILGRGSAEERIALFLSHMFEEAERRGDTTDPIRFPLTRQDMGDYLGLALETVSRTMARLRRKGLIAGQTPHGYLRINDIAALRYLAQEPGAPVPAE